MRFDKRITFIADGDSYYDPSIGDYVDGEEVEDTKPCNLSPLKVDRKKELFGEISTMITVARLQRPYNKKFNRVEIKGKELKVLHRSDYRKGVLFLEGDIVG